VHRSVLWATGFFIALVVNPNFGCGSGGDPSYGSNDGYTYGENEMEAAVVGTYAGTVNIDGTAETVTLTIERSVTTGAAARLTPLCGTRTFSFVKPAGACISISTMALTATLVSSGTFVKSTELTGEFDAYLTLSGELNLSDGSSASLHAMYQDGRFGAWSYASDASGSVGLDLRRE
jgi:hypothetical protein